MKDRQRSDDKVLAPVSVEQVGWQEHPVVVTRLALFIYSAAIALCFILIIGVGVWYTIDRRNQVATNARAIHQLKISTKVIQETTHPTPEQYRNQLREGIKRCLNEPECKRLFPTIEGKK